jgi:hypothetical protein
MAPRTDNLVAHQPAYLPWPGFFSRLLDADSLILLDHVQYTERSWQNRNFVRGPRGERLRLTVPVIHRFGQPISHTRIADERWAARHWRTLTQSYGHARCWPQWEQPLHAVYGRAWTHLADLNEELIRLLLQAFGLQVELVRSSALAPDGARTAMLVDLCQRTGTRVLRVGTGAAEYLDANLLHRAALDVEVATYSQPPYDQGRGSFTPGLSALDLLLHQGPHARTVLADGSQLRPWAPEMAVSG